MFYSEKNNKLPCNGLKLISLFVDRVSANNFSALQLSIINYQLSIINYQLSIINYQLSITCTERSRSINYLSPLIALES